VETPLRIPVPIPEAHIDPVPADGWFLQTSPEICMKQLLAAGHERIFQICKCFRKGERGSRHLPEMTLLEWYTKGMEYKGLMAQTERLLRQAAGDVLKQPVLTWQGNEVALDAPWERLTVAEAFRTPCPLLHGSGTADRPLQ
jgi:lysyl-tRNA synthetase class 2